MKHPLRPDRVQTDNGSISTLGSLPKVPEAGTDGTEKY